MDSSLPTFHPLHSCLSEKAVLHHIEQGNIVIEPFNPKNLGTCSYDVSLGEYYCTEVNNAPLTLINTFHPDAPALMWSAPKLAQTVLELRVEMERRNDANRAMLDKGVSDQDRVIILQPGETILGHTKEFIGGRNCVTSMLKCRSSAGRYALSVCNDAGWGDTGYINRYTMEITNRSRFHSLMLVVGMRYGQIVFFQTDPILNKDVDYTSVGKYQTVKDMSELVSTWKPEHMLPRMHWDREIRP